MVRSSDGQVTQMVREYQKAWHARSANPYSIGIEHEGYVRQPGVVHRSHVLSISEHHQTHLRQIQRKLR